MQRTRIESIGVSLPMKRFFRWGSFDHGIKAGKDCLESSNYSARDIEILINTGIHRDHHLMEPAIAAIFQDKLGINPQFQGRQTFSFDLLNGGCGMLSAAHVIDTLLRTGTARVGMALSSEGNLDSRPDPSYTYPASGAAFIMDLSPKSSIGFGNFVFKTYPQYLELYKSTIYTDQKNGHLKLRIKKEELEQAYLKHAPEIVEELLSLEKITREEIDVVVPSQISKAFRPSLASSLHVAEEKVIDTTHLYEDTLTTSLFLAFHYAQQNNLLETGKKILFLSFGSGVTIGSAVYYL